MPFYARAWRQLVRRRGKTLLLWLILFVAALLIFSTTVVLSSAHQAETALAARTQAKLVCNITNAAQPITDNDVAKIRQLKGVAALNRQMQMAVSLENIMPLTFSTSTAPENSQALLCASDDFEMDGPFADDSYRLTAGSFDLGKNGVVINANLAAQNGLSVGDTLTIKGKAEHTQNFVIVGLFLVGNEEKQSDATLAQARLENQLFTSCDAAAALGAKDAVHTLSVVTNQPEKLNTLAASVENVLDGKVEVTTADQLYQQMVAPLLQLIQVMTLLRVLSTGAAGIIVSLLLTMWLRGRRKEMAVLLSLGERKTALMAQVLLEAGVVFIVAASAAAVVVALLAQRWGSMLAEKLAEGLTLSLSVGDVGVLLTYGGIVIIFAVGVAMLPMLCTPPKRLLSEMEE